MSARTGHAISCILLLSIILLQLPDSTRPALIIMPSFSPEANDIIYEGDASFSHGVIELTKTAFFYHTGRASYPKRIRMWDSSTGALADFTSNFSFTIHAGLQNNAPIFTDGMAFFLAPVDYDIPVNSDGGFLGLFNSSDIRRQVVTVEFDTFCDHWDPVPEHVGINNGSVISTVTAPWNIIAMNDKTGDVSITYSAATKTLAVALSYRDDPQSLGKVNLSLSIDLKEGLPEWVKIGFSATTTQILQQVLINSWTFSSSLDSDVIPSRKAHFWKMIILVASAAAFMLFAVGMAVSYCIVRRRNRSRGGKTRMGSDESVDVNLEKGALPRRFSYNELALATSNFADHLRLGQGGSGHVYRGILNDVGCLVAVKRILTDSTNSEKVFINEVKIISRLNHRNLVQFIGWCHEQGNFLLVYDFMPNGSLDTHLFGNKRTLPWQVRYSIALDLASAIHYLHEESEQCILHRDIKPENVLLDTDFTTKLGDFGVAKLVDRRLRTQMTGVVGTIGYLAPEYVSEGRVSKESDMYSFGIVALEIASGRKTYPDATGYHVPIAKWVWQHYVSGNVVNAADERLDAEFNGDEMERLLMVGLWCTHPKEKERPKAGHVIKVLHSESPLPELPHDMRDQTSFLTTSAPIDHTLLLMTSSLEDGR